MFGALIVLMASGIPIAFAFGVLNLGFLYVLVGPGAVQAIALSSFTSIGTFAFIALPPPLNCYLVLNACSASNTDSQSVTPGYRAVSRTNSCPLEALCTVQ